MKEEDILYGELIKIDAIISKFKFDPDLTREYIDVFKSKIPLKTTGQFWNECFYVFNLFEHNYIIQSNFSDFLGYDGSSLNMFLTLEIIHPDDRETVITNFKDFLGKLIGRKIPKV